MISCIVNRIRRSSLMTLYHTPYTEVSLYTNTNKNMEALLLIIIAMDLNSGIDIKLRISSI